MKTGSVEKKNTANGNGLDLFSTVFENYHIYYAICLDVEIGKDGIELD
jgi:hypothetical protein